LEPTWEALAEQYKDVESIIIGKFDDTKNEVPGIHVHAYPTIMMVRAFCF
jgi:hypothetical protein